MSIRYTAEQLQRRFAGNAGAPGYARVADALRAEGRHDEAIGLCRESLRSRPMVAGYVVLGKTLADTGNLEDAREQFEAALRLDPRCLSAMHALAAIMGKLQWADAAAGYYRSILELEPWDAEIRSLLDGAAHAGGVANSGAMPDRPRADALPPAEAASAGRGEETFVKPDGFQGDVMEVNLNDVADEFLPSGGEDSGVSLEDALEAGATQASERDFSPAPDSAMDRNDSEGLASPPSGPETLGENAPAPISGSDVEERLDSLFGNEDAGTPSATATWTAAAAYNDGFPEASATATGELRTADPGLDPDFPEATVPFDLAEAPDLGVPAPLTPETEAGPGDDDSRVQGEDIERRLDELFNLSDGEERPAPTPLSASALPVAPGPKLGETVVLGETVSFGDQAIPFGDGTTPFEDRMDEPTGPQDDSELVTGQDVADKLDSLFQDPVYPATPFPAEKAPREPGPDEALLSTESMLPSAWTGDAPQVTGADVEAQLDKLFNLEPTVPSPAPETAAEAAGAGAMAAEAVAAEDVVMDAAVAEEPAPEDLGMADAPEPATAFRSALTPTGTERNLDETVTFERPQERDAEKGSLKESVADWLARQEDGPSGGDTLILPNEGMFPEAAPASVPEGKAEDDLFGALAPEEIPGLSETASIEMVDGGDVAQRLDKLFSDAPSGMAAEVPLFEPEDAPLPEMAEPEPEPVLESEMTLEMPIPELDETGTAAGNSGIAPLSLAGNEGEEMAEPSATASESAHSTGPEAANKAMPELAPMLDEEDGYPDEDEIPSEAAAANVATVTLAEIYFQQGLKEQALQIYRQLFEREPENESVRKRIAEIEASKSDTDRGPDSDPRRPRPGLKVPKRKK
jgi:tetratricopeptide (TPR) repeat protein